MSHSPPAPAARTVATLTRNGRVVTFQPVGDEVLAALVTSSIEPVGSGRRVGQRGGRTSPRPTFFSD